MVEAAREALDEKSLDELTLQEITERAGVTVGAFYQRFPSKAAFLKYMEEEAYREIRESSERLFAAPLPESTSSARDLVRAFVPGMAAIYQEHRTTLRELVQRSRSSEARQRRRMDMTRDVVGLAVDWALARERPAGDPKTRKALSVAILFTSSALRDVILFDETWAIEGSPAGIEELVDELVRAAEAYLGVGED
jgi:AcrR family transcriptional regulator